MQKYLWQNICKFVQSKENELFMKKIFPYVWVGGLLAIIISCTSQQLNQLGNVINTPPTEPKLTNEEVIQGLREALSVGTNKSTSLASAMDGFYKNPKIFIPFPPDAIKVKEKVEQLGFKDRVDKFVLTLNRGAEEAAKEAGPIFLSAIKNMSIGDGFAILKGGDFAATEYLKEKTTGQLKTAFQPKVKDALSKVELTKHWNPVITTYNKVPGVEKQDPDLESYVTDRAITGMFVLIQDEEQKIKKDPVARVSDILKKVFGSQ
jgi:hypothetical protein